MTDQKQKLKILSHVVAAHLLLEQKKISKENIIRGILEVQGSLPFENLSEDEARNIKRSTVLLIKSKAVLLRRKMKKHLHYER